MDTLGFYSAIPAFQDFSGLTRDENFVSMPESWWVIITDVKGSTEAIRNGRYKHVNMLGASTITCVMNSLESSDFPFVFGGDGATMVVPESVLDSVQTELESLQAIARQDFNLELRVGFVPLKTLYSEGHALHVAKYELSPGNCLAQFRGTALTRAETMVKKEDPRARILRVEVRGTPPRLEGLSCRLNPLKAKNGTILTLLARPATDQPREAKAILDELLTRLREVFGNDFNSVSPVDYGRLKWKLIPRGLRDEIRLSGNRGVALGIWVSKMLKSLIANLSLTFGLPLGPFNPRTYKAQLVLNSDFKKFDETLRMVIDCTVEQAAIIEEVLQAMKAQGKIFYGAHRSDEALMTCMVRSAVNNRHIHFIDGASGGYALAAVQLKKQMKGDPAE